LIKWLLNFFWEWYFSDDDVREFKTFVSEHVIQEIFHSCSIGWTFDVVHLKMSFSSDQYSHSFSDGSFKLFIKLIDTNSVNEVKDILLFFHAFEDNGDTETNENIIISWASSNLEWIINVLLGYEELNLGPR